MLGASWERVCWGRVARGRRARPWQLGRPWWSPWRAMAQAGRVASSGAAREGRVQANQGRGAGFGRRHDAWGGQVASAPAYGAAVGVVQGNGGGRNGQWQFRN